MIDRLHERGIGVILDWVPAHFPRDEFALAQFDGTALYEHADPRRGAHPDWGTLIFNFGRNEVRNFLTASALYWLDEYHADGLRVDAVASMLYRDYSRAAGEWLPNEYGGREDFEAIELPARAQRGRPRRRARDHRRRRGVDRVAGRLAAHRLRRPGLRPEVEHGLDARHPRVLLEGPASTGATTTTSSPSASSTRSREQFVLPLSHDEVVHGKGSLLSKMPGDDWQKHANLRSLYGYMWAHPGKKLLFMGGELAQEQEWSHVRCLDWHLADSPRHGGVQRLVRDLNHVYRDHPQLWELDAEPAGFRWLVVDDRDANVVAFARFSAQGKALVAAANLSPVPRPSYRLPMPRRPLARGHEHRRGGLRRGGSGKPRRRARRGAPLGRRVRLRRADAAPTGSDLAVAG